MLNLWQKLHCHKLMRALSESLHSFICKNRKLKRYLLDLVFNNTLIAYANIFLHIALLLKY